MIFNDFISDGFIMLSVISDVHIQYVIKLF